LRDVLRVRRNETWYNYNRDDPKVFWADACETIISGLHLRGAHEKLGGILKRVAHRLQVPIVRRQQAVIRASGRVEAQLRDCGHILFLCYGNINRSALAEQHLKGLVAPDMQIFSCGFHMEDRRPLDPMMRKLAKESGILFGPWSSRTINQQLVSEAGLIFAMETAHLVRLFAEYPESRGRAFLLSCVTRPDTIPLEISDPYGGNAEAYRRCIRQITYATALISKIVRASHKVEFDSRLDRAGAASS
jgi:protein-tyrosine-phosphatase